MPTKIPPQEIKISLQGEPASNDFRESNPKLESQHRYRRRNFFGAKTDPFLVTSKKSKRTSPLLVPKSSGDTRIGLSHRGQAPASASDLSKLPAELAEMIFDYCALNPIQLMTLLNAKNSDGWLSSASLSASRNKYWASYAPQIQNSEAIFEGYHAQQFIERYRAMPPENRKVLDILWTGKIEEKNGIVSKMLEQHWASAWNSCDIVRAVLDFRDFNPFQLVTLLGDETRDVGLSNVNLVARSNKYWASFAPQGQRNDAIREGDHAQQFIERYQAMSELNKRVLKKLWTGTNEEKNEIVSTMMELPLASAWNSFDIVRAAIGIDGRVWEYTRDELRLEREIVLAALKQDGEVLETVSGHLQRDREIVLTAVEQNGNALQFAHEDLKNDREVVLTAVKEYGRALGFASENLRSDRKIVLAAVKQAGEAFEFAHDDLKDDRELVLTVVKQDGWALEFASERLKSDREIVLAAVKQAGEALQAASEDLKRDPELRALAGWLPLP